MIGTLLILAIGLLGLVASLWLVLVWGYRQGFRDSVDFMAGSIPLPYLIVTWKGAITKDPEQ